MPRILDLSRAGVRKKSDLADLLRGIGEMGRGFGEPLLEIREHKKKRERSELAKLLFRAKSREEAEKALAGYDPSTPQEAVTLKTLPTMMFPEAEIPSPWETLTPEERRKAARIKAGLETKEGKGEATVETKRVLREAELYRKRADQLDKDAMALGDRARRRNYTRQELHTRYTSPGAKAPEGYGEYEDKEKWRLLTSRAVDEDLAEMMEKGRLADEYRAKAEEYDRRAKKGQKKGKVAMGPLGWGLKLDRKKVERLHTAWATGKGEVEEWVTIRQVLEKSPGQIDEILRRLGR